MVCQEEYITAYGHPNVTATHRTTFEVTKEGSFHVQAIALLRWMQIRVPGILSRRFRDVLQHPKSRLDTTIRCGPYEVHVSSRGDPALSLTHVTDLVWRRSSFTCDRTVGICSDYTACDLPREMIDLLIREEEICVLMIASYPDEVEKM
jgi:hypothetical protein